MRRLLTLVWAMLLCCAMAAAQAEAPLTSPVIIRSAGDNEEHKLAQVTITNVHEPERTQYTVNKVWQDEDNRAGIRGPYGVQLYANGSPVGSPVMLEADTLSYTWENLYRYDRGEEILYTVDEVCVPEGYQREVQGNTVTNRYILHVFEGEVCKFWDDGGDQDGLRPQTITLHLYAEGIQVSSLELTAENGWSGTFGSLPVYVRDAERMGWPIPVDAENPAREIRYTLAEEEVPGYTFEYEQTPGGFMVTNTHEPACIQIPVKKIWDDSANEYEYRPEAITVRLLANDAEVDSLVLTKENGWRGVFMDHPVNLDGEPIVYTLIEDEVKRYKTAITGSAEEGFTVRNALIYGYDVPFTKIWQDNREEHPTPQFVLYNPDGTVHRTQNQPPADRGDGHYVYSLVNEEDYYVVELPMEGYYTEYVNQGEAASVTDRAYAGGTIINIAIADLPPTGDSQNLWGYLLLLAGSVTGLILLRRRKE